MTSVYSNSNIHEANNMYVTMYTLCDNAEILKSTESTVHNVMFIFENFWWILIVENITWLGKLDSL